MSNDDRENILLESAVNGDREAAERLFLIHYTTLARYIERRIPAAARRHFGADDILQLVFFQAFKDIPRYQIRPAGSFVAWLKSIADHRLADALKKLRRKKFGGEWHRLSMADVGNSRAIANLIEFVRLETRAPYQSVARHEVEKAMHVAMATLPADQRALIRARYFDGKSVKEIAAVTGRPVGAVRGLIYRAKKKLRESLGRSSDWYSRL